MADSKGFLIPAKYWSDADLSLSEKGKQITLRFPKELYQQLQKEAERMGISVNALISIILNDYL